MGSGFGGGHFDACWPHTRPDDIDNKGAPRTKKSADYLKKHGPTQDHPNRGAEAAPASEERN